MMDGRTVTLKEFLVACRRHLLLLVLFTVFGTLAAGAYALLAPAQYTAKATAYVQVNIDNKLPTNPDANIAGVYYSASQLALQKASAFTPLFASRAVAGEIREELGLEQPASAIANSIDASDQANGLTIDVTASAASPTLAQQIADAAVTVTAKKVRQLEGQSSPVRLILMTSAKLAEPVKSPSLVKFTGLGFAGGLGLGLVLVVLFSAMNTRVRSVADLQEGSELRVLSVIPKNSAIARTNNAEADAYDFEYVRKLRTSLRYAELGKETHTVLVTSAEPGAGKSTVAQALARVFAQSGKQVLLLEADLRRPTAAETFELPAGPGLTEIMFGTAELEQAIYETSEKGLRVLPAGDTVPYPSEVLGSERMKQLLSALARKFTIIIDSPPILPVTDSEVLTSLADLTVLVVSAGKTRSAQVAESLRLIEANGGHCAGFVLNRAGHASVSGAYHSNYRYSGNAKRGKARRRG